jgi:hypothetical protein
LVVEVTDDRGNLRPPESCYSAETSLTSDELPSTTWLRAHGDWLKEPIDLDRCLKLHELRLREGTSGLESIWSDVRDPDALKVGALAYIRGSRSTVTLLLGG